MTLVDRGRGVSIVAPAAAGGRRTLADELRLQLADEILRGLISPGAALDETELAAPAGARRRT